MTDILCTWLNDELQMSKRITPATFAHDFSSGYLLGEVLYKYQLQDDFDQFSTSRAADSKLHNFTRLEPMMHLLGIPFDAAVARDVMTEKHGTSTRLLYQMYIALSNKKKANLTQTAMRTLQFAAPAKLGAIESDIFKERKDEVERLKQAVQRQTDIDLQALVNRFHKHQTIKEKKTLKESLEEAENLKQERQRDRECLLNRSRVLRERQSELVARINAATVHVAKPPPNRALKALEAQKEVRRKREAEETVGAIHLFEEKLRAILPPSDDGSSLDIQFILKRPGDQEEETYATKGLPNNDYINKIRKRLQEESVAREEREKRRRKVLRDQMSAHLAQEETRREEMMVNRLLRQSQQERRIVVQLLQARHEKEVIRHNRMMRDRQYQDRREKDFLEALDREAEAAAQLKSDYAEQIKVNQHIHDQIAAQRAEMRYQRHYNMCSEIMGSILDFASKVVQYRELTNNLVPAKLMREWKLLFAHGEPLFEHVNLEVKETSAEQVLEEERLRLLDEGDFMEYRGMTGEWLPPEDWDIKEPPDDNPVVSHIVQRLFSIVHPPSPPASAPEFPALPIRVCVLGKTFAGKTTCIKRLAFEHKLQVLCPETLVQEAVTACLSGEAQTAEQETQADLNEETPADSSSVTDHTSEQDTNNANDTPIDDVEKQSSRESSQVHETATASSERKTSEQSKVLSVESKVKHTGPEPTLRAQLGSKAMKSLKKGQPVPDQVVVDILIEAMRKVPKGTGWILDGYPHNYNQAKLLEKALSGCDPNAADKCKEFMKEQKSKLVPRPAPQHQLATPPSGIDVVILFDIRDELCLKRASGRYRQLLAEKSFHEEYDPPPVGTATGLGKTEKIEPVSDPSYEEQNVQTRITGFLDNWTKLRKWFVKFGTLRSLDASLAKETVYLETEKILEDTIALIEQRGQQGEVIVAEKHEETQQEPAGSPVATPPGESIDVPVSEVPDDRAARTLSKSSSRSKTEEAAKTESSKVSGESKQSKKSGAEDELPIATKVSSEKVLEVEGPSHDEKPVVVKQEADVEFNVVISVALGSAKSRSSSKDTKSKSPKGKKSDAESPSRKKTKGPASAVKRKPSESKSHETDIDPALSAEAQLPNPGDADWIFVDLCIDDEVAKVLMALWEEMEAMYTNNLKAVFRNVRFDREVIYRYFFKIRKDFVNYLKKPDCKQEYVVQWQKAYNQVPDDMREDEEVRAELHQQANDLVERLWNICDERKEQAEAERRTIINDEWLGDRVGILTNHYFTIMQAEVDRFQDTVRLLKDYYRGMDGLIPDVLDGHYERIPLLELHCERLDKPDKVPSGVSVIDEDKTSERGSSRLKTPRQSPKENKTSISKKKSEKDVEKTDDQTSEGIGLRIVIPLIHSTSFTADTDSKHTKVFSKESKEKVVARKGKDEFPLESLLAPQDPENKIIYEVYTIAAGAISQLTHAEMMIKEAEEEAERLKESEKEKEKAKFTKAVKTKKPGSPPSKKAVKGKEPEVTLVVSSDHHEHSDEEELQKRLIKSKAREELYFSIQEEAKAATIRLGSVCRHAYAVLNDLKSKAEEAFRAMNDWLGAKFLKEMESIDHMALVMHNAIEIGEKIKYEILLETDNFILDEDLKILKTPSPEVPPLPVEEPMADQFTVDQLKNLYEQLRSIAPGGIMSKKTFTDMLDSLVAITLGMEALPEMWMHLTSSQIEELGNVVASDSDYVDWRTLLVALCHPIPTPTQHDLLRCLHRFRKMDQRNTGTVTREQWPWIELWFHPEPCMPQEFDRLSSLKELLFEMFADHSSDISTLDYVNFLLYFSVTANYHEGFLRALSVATGQHMPRLCTILPLPSTHSKNLHDSVLDGPDNKGEDKKFAEPPMSDEVIPPESLDAEVSLEALFKVLHHSDVHSGDSHRFSVTADPEDHTSIERLTAVFQELNEDDSTDPIMYRVLIQHPLIQDVVDAKQFKTLDLKPVLSRPQAEILDMPSVQD